MHRVCAWLTDICYSVQELPEALYDYVYDFGFLGEGEEESYVRAMVEPIFPAIAGRRSAWVECVKDSRRASKRMLERWFQRVPVGFDPLLAVVHGGESARLPAELEGCEEMRGAHQVVPGQGQAVILMST